ncbi:MAG TPA: hypothetical protein DCS93_26200 [Microscillaceae bacterium]|nr:hypothetical protein [Microscillaceae bacterium]
MQPTIIITGANGLIGSFLVNFFAQKQWRVKAFARNPIIDNSPLVEYHPFEMPNKINENAFVGADYLIHCAVAKYTRRTPDADKVNIQGTQKLLELSRKHKLKRFVFFSTMSAHAQAQSHYGKHKLYLESVFDLSQDVILKPGLVLGNGGLFETIKNTIQKSKIIPLVGGGHQPIQTIHIQQLAEAIDLILKKSLTGIFYLGENQPITLKQLHQALAIHLGLKRRFLALPTLGVGIALKTIDFLRIPTAITYENLLGLKALKAFDTTSTSEQLAIDFKTYEESIQAVFAPKKNG